ncbi:MAG: hybrid sensor histidine kinase/response regulator [Chloroflexi bacterium]|nr:hybrid sensor histidine kinase/response regulator [Chloroflexota bacterium]
MVKVLVIEDERNVLEDLVELLDYAGYESRGANSGTAGLEMTYAWMPNVIVCDHHMPDMTGVDVVRSLRSDAATALIPFILFTGATDDQLRHLARVAGVDDFVAKPVTSRELIETIDARLQRHALICAGAEQKLEMARTQLARMVTHELRTPLISLNTVVEIISRQIGQLTPQETLELLETITAGSRRLTHRVEQLVFITQLDAGVLSSESIIADGMDMAVWELLIAANNLAKRFAYQMQPGVTVIPETRDNTSLVLCDPYALKQAFAELIANALTFSPPNSDVSLQQWRHKSTIYISITDCGPGIPQEKLEQALQRFQQIDREEREQQGMGVGLWLAQRILWAHHGALDIRSVEGKGTQVIIRLPVSG